MRQGSTGGLWTRRQVLRAAGLALFGCLLPARAQAQTKIGGVSYLSASAVASQYGLKWAWEVPQKTVRLFAKGVSISFTVNASHIVLNGNPVALGSPVVKMGRSLYLTERDVEKNIAPLLRPQKFPPLRRASLIVIDPGHGGNDPGAQNRRYGLAEKALTLDIAQRLQRILKARGFQAVLTRKSDVALARASRTAIANNAKADLFVSIHFNSFDNPAVSGLETWALTPAWQRSTGRSKFYPSDRVSVEGNRHDAQNILAAYYVLDSMQSALARENRGVKRARFDVLTGLKSPGLLVECGFLSNPAEAQLIRTPAYREKIAIAIADGITRYRQTINRITAPKK